MENRIDSLSKYAPTALRWGLGFVFIWFGWQSIINPNTYAGLVPQWVTIIAPTTTLVFFHGIFEFIAGLILFSGFFPRTISAVLFLDLLNIIYILGGGDIAVRDTGLASAMLAVFLFGK